MLLALWRMRVSSGRKGVMPLLLRNLARGREVVTTSVSGWRI